jgi:DNA repair ATPase RecN
MRMLQLFAEKFYHPENQELSLTIVLLTRTTRLGLFLLDIHSQQQTRELSDESVQFNILDAIVDNQSYINEYQLLLLSYKKINLN